MTTQTKPTILTILGSIRPDNNSAKVLQLAVNQLLTADCEVAKIDPNEYDLFGTGAPGTQPIAELQAKVKAADGVLMVTPEYSGSFSAVLKLVIENMGYPATIENKPVALIGIASGNIGAVKSLEHLRSVCGHIGAVVLPYSLSIPTIERFITPEGKCTDDKVLAQIQQVADRLVNYLQPS